MEKRRREFVEAAARVIVVVSVGLMREFVFAFAFALLVVVRGAFAIEI